MYQTLNPAFQLITKIAMPTMSEALWLTRALFLQKQLPLIGLSTNHVHSLINTD